MKYILVAYYAVGSFFCMASYTMREINIDLFVPGVDTDILKYEINNETLLKTAVSYLFEGDFLGHSGSKSYDTNASFDAYFKRYKKCYHLIDLDHDGIVELIFNGFGDDEMEVELLEVYMAVQKEWLQVYEAKGNLAGLKKHPNTSEILLYLHTYPCCNNGSHNLNRLRLVKNKMHEVRRYFVGRDTNMKGKFFPDKSTFNGRFYTLKNKQDLFWSPGIIKLEAWPGRVNENKIASYDKGTVYSVLSSKGKWKFVLMHAAPVNEPNRVINPLNFNSTWIYGWLN